MNEAAIQFIKEQFEFVSSIESSKNKLAIVRNIETRELLVKKTLHTSDKVYGLIKDLDSPYFPKIYYIFSKDNETVIFEEYVQGSIPDSDSFAEFTHKTQLKLIMQLCDAIEVLHREGIIHRDIKPSNVIIIQTQSIRLIDFDAARLKNDIADTDTRYLGTQGYAPPEQYGFSQTDERSDIYALGQFIAAVFGRKRPHAMKKVIAKCTEFDPKRRFQTIAEVKKSIKNANHTVRNKMLKVGFAIILTAVCTTVGFTLWQKSKPQMPAGGIAIDINAVSYDLQEFVKSGLIFMSGQECKEQYLTDQTVWLSGGLASPDKFGIYNIVPSEKFLKENTSKTKAVYQIENTTEKSMKNIEVFVSIHDASVCSNGDIDQFTKTHCEKLLCDKLVYVSIGKGEIAPNEVKQIVINPHYSKLYSEFACLSVCISMDGNLGYADMITLTSLIFE